MVPSDVTAAPRRRARIIQRRRRMFLRLVALVLVTLPLGAVPSLRWVWFLNLAADAALGLYIWRLLQWKREEASRPVVSEPESVPQPMLLAAPELRPEPALAFEDTESEEFAATVRPRLVTRTG